MQIVPRQSRSPAFREPLDAQDWLDRLFSAQAARKGGVVRRKSRDIDQLIGRVRFIKELERRNFHAVENGDQIVVFCNDAPVRILR